MCLSVLPPDHSIQILHICKIPNKPKVTCTASDIFFPIFWYCVIIGDSIPTGILALKWLQVFFRTCLNNNNNNNNHYHHRNLAILSKNGEYSLSIYICVLYPCVMNMTPMGTEVQRTFHAFIAVDGSRPESSQSVIHMIGSTSSCWGSKRLLINGS